MLLLINRQANCLCIHYPAQKGWGKTNRSLLLWNKSCLVFVNNSICIYGLYWATCQNFITWWFGLQEFNLIQYLANLCTQYIFIAKILIKCVVRFELILAFLTILKMNCSNIKRDSDKHIITQSWGKEEEIITATINVSEMKWKEQ